MATEQAQLKYEFINLTSKPTAQLCYSFSPSTSSSTSEPVLLVFVNGLGLPQAGWVPTIAKLREIRPKNLPAILTYDRFGQGQTVDRDPADANASDASHGHDCISAVQDLRQLITQLACEKMGVREPGRVPLVLVSNSIGCALARLYAQEHPGIVAGIVLLDSVLANSDFVSIFPDPDTTDFEATALPEGITETIIRSARDRVRMMFHPDIPNKEGLSRKNLAQLLPHADSPVLKGVDEGCGPYVTVVGHEFETFAKQTERMMGVPIPVSKYYSNPYWHTYNQGLAKITDSGRSKGPLQAPGAGHFVQADNPGFVAGEVDEILTKVMP